MAKSDQVVFEKQMQGGNQVRALRKEVPYVALPRDPDGPTPIAPKRIGEYSVYLTPVDKNASYLVWQKTVYEYSETDFVLMDIHWEGNTLIVMSRIKIFLQTEIYKLSLPLGVDVIKSKAIASEYLVLKESSATGSIKAAKLQGSLKDGNLSVLVTCTLGNPIFHWKNNKWVPKQTESLTTLAQVKKSVDGKMWQVSVNVDPVFPRQIKVRENETKEFKGTRLWIEKVPLGENGLPVETEKFILWDTWSFNNLISLPHLWTGDVYLDEKTKETFALLSNSSQFWIQVVDFSRREGISREGDPILVPHFEARTINPPRAITEKLPFIEAISLEKFGDELLISIGKKEKPEQKWAYSLATRQWKEVPLEEAKAN